MGDLAHPWQPSHFEQQLDQSMPFLRQNYVLNERRYYKMK